MKKVMMFALTLFASIMIIPTTYALGDDVTTNEVTYVASVGGKNYETVQEAINNANGQTVTLLTDVTESVTISNGTTVTLDLGSYTLTNENGEHTITNNGNLTVIGSGTVDNVSHAKGAVLNQGTFTLEGPTLIRSKEAGVQGSNGNNSWYVVDNNGGIFYMQSGKIESTSRYSSCIRNLEATFYMNGGELVSDFITLKNDDNGTIYMNGGTISTNAEGGSGIQNWGTLEFRGGTVNAVEGAASIYTLSWSDDYKKPTTFIDDNAIINGTILIEIDNSYQGTKYPELTIDGGKITGNIIDRVGTKIVINGGQIIGNIFPAEDSNLEIKAADYSKVKELVDKVKTIDSTLYTEESWKILDNIIQNIDYSKNFLDQADVNDMALAIENAIKGLVKVEEPDVEKPDVDFPDFPNVDLPENEVKDEEVNPKTSDSISYAYIALFISGIGMLISLKKLA